MDFIQIFTILAVATGAVFLGASLFPHLRAVPIIPKRLRFKWVLMAALMSFFLIGYFSFLFIQVKELKFPLELLTSAVFFGGGFFSVNVVGVDARLDGFEPGVVDSFCDLQMDILFAASGVMSH